MYIEIKSISVALYENNFNKRNFYVKNGFKKKENKSQKHGKFPVMNVGNSPQLVYMDRLFHILPGNVKSETGS